MEDQANVPQIFATDSKLFRLLARVIHNQGLKLGTEWNVSDGSNHGDNFIAVVKQVVHVAEGGTAVNFIVKRAPKNAARRDAFNIREQFLNEIEVYEKAMPRLKQLGIDLPVANYYGSLSSEGEETVIMTNLKEEAFGMANRREGLSKEQCSAVLRALAQLHAASFALRERSPEEFKALAGSVKEMFWDEKRRHTFEPFMANANQETLRLINEYYGSDQNKCSRAFAKILNLGYEFLADIVTRVPDCKKVLLHGDCWTNNLLFRTDAKGNIHAKLLDFQLARISMPPIDIIFFLFTSTNPINVKENLSEFLQDYYEEFQRCLKTAGLDAAKLYPQSELLADWIACVPYGLVVAGILAPALYCPDECLPNLETVQEDSRDAFVKEYGKVMQANTPESKEHLGQLLELCLERKWLEG